MDSKSFMLILFSLTVALATESNATLTRLIEATDTTPFAQCNPFNATAKGITSCEDYFESSALTFEACDLNLGRHDICVGAIPEGKGSLREICPTECAGKVLDPELEDDALAVENFIDFLKKEGRRGDMGIVSRGGRRQLHSVHHQNCEGYKNFIDLPADWCEGLSRWAICGIGDGVVYGSGYGCGFQEYGVGTCKDLNSHDQCVEFALPTVCGPDDYAVVDIYPHPTYGPYGRYFEITSNDWRTMAGAWNSVYNIDQWRGGVRIVENRQIRGWEVDNAIHGRYEPFSSSVNGDWQPDDIISLTGKCEIVATRVCGPDDYAVVDIYPHPTYGPYGRYFEISSNDWRTMAGAWNSVYNIDHWRNGVRIVENRQIRGWEVGNAIHGRYEPFSSSVNGNWQAGDIISLTGNCEMLTTV